MSFGIFSGASALWTGPSVGRVFGGDAAATQTWLRARMTAGGASLAPMFAAGLGALFLGAGGAGVLAEALFEGPMRMNPYAMNPGVMGSLPYSPLALSAGAWL